MAFWRGDAGALTPRSPRWLLLRGNVPDRHALTSAACQLRSHKQRWGNWTVHTIAAALLAGTDRIHFFREIDYEHDGYMHCPLDGGAGGVPATLRKTLVCD